MRYSVTENQAECCGCFACASVCPVGAISMKPDKEGCIYPVIDTDKCIECGLCEKTCTINKPITKFCGGYSARNQTAYALRYIDENQRDMSASGGAFSAIAEICFDTHPKCVVFGAAWVENNKVQHIAVESKEELYLLRKSKYVQSEIGDAYIKCKKYLNDGFFVVFSGTPCQIAGLKSYLGKDYDSLLTIDIVCHGTPPAWVLESYVNSIEKRYGQKVKNITFRYKKKDLLGTTQSKKILIELDNNKKIVQSARKNYYLRGFQIALFYRSVCYDCKYATHQRVSDITVGDYWSIQDVVPEMIDTSGVSCVLVNSEAGNAVFESLMNKNGYSLEIKETSIDFLYQHNGLLCAPIEKHKQRDRFMELLQHTDFCDAIDLTLGKRNKVKTTILDLMPYKVFYSLRRFF